MAEETYLNRELVDQFIEYLNGLLEIDRVWLSSLCGNRPECNDGIADHPTLQAGRRDDGQTHAGVIGLLNGFIGAHPVNGWGAIAGCFDEETGLITEFIVSPLWKESASGGSTTG